MRAGQQVLIGLLALLAGLSVWLVVPWMQDVANGADMPAERWVDGIVPLTLALTTFGCAAWCSRRSSTNAARPLLPFVVLTAFWALTLSDQSDLLWAVCLVGMPVLATLGGVLSIRALGQKEPARR